MEVGVNLLVLTSFIMTVFCCPESFEIITDETCDPIVMLLMFVHMGSGGETIVATFPHTMVVTLLLKYKKHKAKSADCLNIIHNIQKITKQPNLPLENNYS